MIMMILTRNRLTIVTITKKILIAPVMTNKEETDLNEHILAER